MKHCFNHSCFSLFRRKNAGLFLAFCWCAGLVFGTHIAWQTGEIHYSLMQRAGASPMSIVGLAALLLPFLFTAFAVVISNRWLFLPLAFLKAALFGYHASLISAAFGSAGWLVRYLLLFTDACTVPILLWIWLWGLRMDHCSVMRQIICCILAAVVIGMIDYRIVSPFLATLIST